MSVLPADQGPASPPATAALWFTARQSTSWGYTVELVVWFSLFFWALMLIPYLYDQLNRAEYEEADRTQTLVFREFHNDAPLPSERSSCAIRLHKKFCSDIEILAARKIISLDYVTQLKNASKLDFSTFIVNMLLAFAMICVILIVIDRTLPSKPSLVFLIIMLVFFGLIFWTGLSGSLPHKNTKFYFIMGSLYALLLPTMYYLHRTNALIALPPVAPAPAPLVEMIKLAYGRWSQGLGVGLAVVLTIAATVSFNIVNYLTTTFGESFTLYPLIGVIIAVTIAIAAFFWGAARPVYHILLEIEAELVRRTP